MEDMMEQPQIIAITGASSGIGEGLARIFSQNNFIVILMSRNLQAMKKLQLKNSYCYQLDVTNFQSIQECVLDIEKKIGPVDFWVNNAGVCYEGEFCEISTEKNHEMIDVNLKGVIHCTEAILPFMQKRKSGMIINISSVAGRASRANLSVYAATKAAIISLSESLRVANARHGVRICNVSPGIIETPMLNHLSLRSNPALSVESFAKTILWITQQPKEVCIRDIVIAPTSYEA
jgi:NADP-dependent 3-hydroxy acid dehydrogenase YdfG